MGIKPLKISFFFLVCFGFSATIFSQKILEISFQENHKTKSSFLRKFVKVRKGDQLDSLALKEDVKRLKRLPAISHAYFKVDKKDEGYRLIYGVQENFTIIPEVNFYSTNDGELAFRTGVFEYNFLGRNIKFGGVYQYDVFNSFALNFRAPQLFSKYIGLALSHNNLSTREPVFLDNGTADYKYNNVSYEALGLFQFNLRHRIEIGGSFFTEDYEYIEGLTSEDVPQDFKVDKNLFKLIYEYNNLDYFFQYVSGFKSVLNFQYVISTDNRLPSFTIFFNDFFYFKRIGRKGNLANRLRLGLATNDDSPFAPFAVDNNLNIRGVGNTIDRGTGVIVLNTEYRHTLIDKKWFTVQSNLFVDLGSWRNPGGEFGDFGDSQNFRVYPGGGIRFIHKRIFNAVFRIDYGFGITPDATNGFVFGVGQYF